MSDIHDERSSFCSEVERQAPRRPKRSRQPNHEGTLERLPSGKVRYSGFVRGKRLTGPARTTLREAKLAYRTKVLAILHPSPPEPLQLPTVEQYATTLLATVYARRVIEGTMALHTLQLYEQVVRLNVRGSALGVKRLDEVLPSEVEEWWMGLVSQPRTTQGGAKVFPSRPLSAASKARYLVMLSAIFEYARVKERLIGTNPAQIAAKPRPERSSFRILSAEEVGELLEICHSKRLRGIALLGLHGLGPAEMCALKRSDYDGEGIEVRRQRQRLGGHGVLMQEVLKTSQRRAWVAANRELKSYLDQCPDGWVLHGSKGEPLEPANVRRDLALALAGTQFEGLRPYDLRHTFAQRLLDENVDVQTAAELLRHSCATFLRRYVRSDRGRKMAAVRRLDGKTYSDAGQLRPSSECL